MTKTTVKNTSKIQKKRVNNTNNTSNKMDNNTNIRTQDPRWYATTKLHDIVLNWATRVSDPCYQICSNSGKTLITYPGKWEVFTIAEERDGIVNSAFLRVKGTNFTPKDCDIDMGELDVDSGQMSVCKYTDFPPEGWQWKAHRTFEPPMDFSKVALIDGFGGDGTYDLYVAWNEQKTIHAMYIEFHRPSRELDLLRFDDDSNLAIETLEEPIC